MKRVDKERRWEGGERLVKRVGIVELAGGRTEGGRFFYPKA